MLGPFKIMRGRPVANFSPAAFDFVVRDVTELTAALSLASSGQVIGLLPGTYAGVDLGTHVFSPAVTISSYDASNRAIVTYFEAANCSGFTFVSLDFVVLLPAAYGWRYDACSNLTYVNCRVRSNGVVPEDFELVVGIRFFSSCSNILVAGCELYRLNECLQFGLGTHDFRVTTSHFHDINSDGMDIGAASNGMIDLNYFHDFFPTGEPVNHPDCVQFTDDTQDISIINNLVWKGAGEATQGVWQGEGFTQRPTVRGNLIVGTGFSAIRFTGCVDALIDGNTLVSYQGEDHTNILVQTSDRVTITNNATLAGANGTSLCTNVTFTGNTENAAVTDSGAAAIAAYRLLHPTIPH